MVKPCASRSGRFARGFTLIELAVAITVLAVLTTIATPSFSNLFAVSRGKTTTTNFYLALTKARSSAVKFNTNVTIAPNSGGWQKGWTISYVPLSGGSAITLASESDLPTGVTVSGAPASVVFNSSGRALTQSSFQITAASGSSSDVRCVSVDTGGHPYIKASAC
jgi:type IV fimbrial biogenesis protein FimT